MAETAKNEVVETEIDTRMEEKEAEQLARDFEKWDNKILNLQKSLAGDFWDLGEALFHIQEDKLYKAIEDCTTFTQYLEIREFNKAKKATSWNSIRVFKKLKREKAIELGRTVSYAITSLSGSDFDEALSTLSRKKFSTRKAKALIAEKKGGKKSAKKPTATMQTLTVINSRTNEVRTVIVPKNEVVAVIDDRKVEKTYAVKTGVDGISRIKKIDDKKMLKEAGEGFENFSILKLGTMSIQLFISEGQVKGKVI